jgi:hypothetical protein
MSAPVRRHKHLKLDQQKIDFAKRYFGVSSEQDAIDRALGLLMQEERIVRRLKVLRGALRGHDPGLARRDPETEHSAERTWL